MSPGCAARTALVGMALAAACATARPQAASYSIDVTHTFVSFEVLHAGMSTTRVRFDRQQASLQFDRAARGGRVEFRVEMDSVNSGVPAFDARLKGRDFFDVAENPGATFVSERFSFTGNQVNEVAGTLTLRGRSQAVSFKALNFNCYTSPLFRREVCGGDFEAVIQPSQWGIVALPAVASDSVRVRVQIEAIKQ